MSEPFFGDINHVSEAENLISAQSDNLEEILDPSVDFPAIFDAGTLVEFWVDWDGDQKPVGGVAVYGVDSAGATSPKVRVIGYEGPYGAPGLTVFDTLPKSLGSAPYSKPNDYGETTEPEQFVYANTTAGTKGLEPDNLLIRSMRVRFLSDIPWSFSLGYLWAGPCFSLKGPFSSVESAHRVSVSTARTRTSETTLGGVASSSTVGIPSASVTFRQVSIVDRENLVRMFSRVGTDRPFFMLRDRINRTTEGGIVRLDSNPPAFDLSSVVADGSFDRFDSGPMTYKAWR